MKSKTILIAVYFAFSVLTFGQTSETFDLITYQTPKGWQKEVGKDAVQFGAENSNGGTCLITMFKALPGSNDSKANFEAAWESIVQETVKVGKPQMNPAEAENGWTIENGLAPYESDGNKGAVILITATGNGKMVNFLILTNTDAFQTDIESFIDSVQLPKIEAKSQTNTTSDAPNSRTNSTLQAKNDGYTFSTINWDDGWTSVVQDDWVLVSKGQIKVRLLYALPYNASQFSGTGVRARDYFWDTHVSKYFDIQTKQYRDEDSIGSFNAEYVEGLATDRHTGEKVFVAMYLSISPNTAWLKIAAAPNENLFRQQFPNSHKQYQSDLESMQRYNQFSVATKDIIGSWTNSDTATAHWYYVTPSGYESYAGMTIASTSAVFNFNPGGVYSSQHSGTTGSVGNLNSFKQNYKGNYKVTDWAVTATNRWDGKTENFKAWFEIIRGGRILVLDTGGVKYNLVKVK